MLHLAEKNSISDTVIICITCTPNFKLQISGGKKFSSIICTDLMEFVTVEFIQNLTFIEQLIGLY